MKKLNLSYIILGLVLTLTGCFPSKVAFEPISCEKFKDCKETIKQVMKQQIRKKSPGYVEVTDESIAWDKGYEVPGAFVSAYRVTKHVLYFKNINKLELVSKKGHYEIRMFNKASGDVDMIFLYDKDLAIRGYSAIRCMMDKLSTNNDDELI